MTSTSARAWFGVNALVVFVGLVVQVAVTAEANEAAFFDVTWKRVLNILCFFTVLSNIAVGVSSLLLATGYARRTTWFCSLRLIGLVGITLTFIVFHAVLRELQDLTGDAAFADLLLHTVSPLMCVIGWLWFGPRGFTSRAAVIWALTFVVVWGVITLVRGEAIGFYPYPFMDPADSGYARVALNLIIIAAIFVALATGAHLLDRRLRDRTGTDTPVPSAHATVSG